jgi:hypothetical protein
MASDTTNTVIVAGIGAGVLYVLYKIQSSGGFCTAFPSWCDASGNFNLLAPLEPGGSLGPKPGDIVVEPDGSQSILNADGSTTPIGTVAASKATAAQTGQAPGTPVVNYPGTPDGCWPSSVVDQGDGTVMSIPPGAHYCSWVDALENWLENPITTGPYQPL